MAETTVVVQNDLTLPYGFKPEGKWSSNEESDDNIDDGDDSQASSTKWLGNTRVSFRGGCCGGGGGGGAFAPPPLHKFLPPYKF